MNAPLRQPVMTAEFLDREERQPRKHELLCFSP